MSVTGESIDPNGLALGPRIDRTDNGEPIEDELGMAVNMLRAQPGATVDPELEWLVRYGAAEAAGMAVTVDLPEPGAPVDRLYVIGVRTADSPQEGSASLGPASRTCVFRRPRLHSRRHRHQQHAAQIRVEPRGQRPGTAVHRSCCVGQRLGCRCVVGRARHRHGRAHRTRRRHLDRSRSGSGIRDRVVASDVGDILGQGTGADRDRRRPAGGGREEVRTHAINHVRGRGPLPSLRVESSRMACCR